MAFSDMNDVEQELGEEKPPKRNGNGNGNRTFLIIAGTLGGIMVLALLCIAGLALYRYIPAQRAAQNTTATQSAQDTAVAFASSQTAAVPTATATKRPTNTPTNTPTATKTRVVVIAPTKSPTLDPAIATRDASLTQTAVHTPGSQTATAEVVATLTATPQATATRTATPQATETATPQATATQTATVQSTAVPTATTIPIGTPSRPTATALPGTGIADELGLPGLITAAFVLVMVVFLMRRLRTAS